MKKKLILYYMILMILGLTITGIIVSQAARSFYKDEVQEMLADNAYLIGYQIEKQETGINYDELAKTYASVINDPQRNNNLKADHLRVTVISYDGSVLGDSDASFAEMGSHLDRKEIREAMAGKIGSDIRYSQTLKTEFFYVAIPLKDLKLIVRTSIPLYQLKKNDNAILIYMLIGILAGIFLTLLPVFRFLSVLTAPLEKLLKFSRRISGNTNERSNISKTIDEFGEITDNIEKIKEKLNTSINEYEGRTIGFETIIDSIPFGIINVDPELSILLINKAAAQIFGVDNPYSATGKKLIDVIRINGLIRIASDTIRLNIILNEEIITGAPYEKILKITASPVKHVSYKDCDPDAVIFVQDVTNLKKLELIRTEFVSNVTHELKTPLTSIRGFIETLKNGAFDDRSSAMNFLEIIDIEAERLNTLINDVLQLSEIETRQKDTNIELLHLNSIISEVVSLLEGAACSRKVVIKTDILDDIKILANKDRIKQLLINLIDNAIKYNVENGQINIIARRTEGYIIIRIRDTGIGILPEHMDRIFERFYRVDKGRSRNMGGTGLGLSIVKHIVNLYNGDITLISEPGKGSEFTVRLPVQY